MPQQRLPSKKIICKRLWSAHTTPDSCTNEFAEVATIRGGFHGNTQVAMMFQTSIYGDSLYESLQSMLLCSDEEGMETGSSTHINIVS